MSSIQQNNFIDLSSDSDHELAPELEVEVETATLSNAKKLKLEAKDPVILTSDSECEESDEENDEDSSPSTSECEESDEDSSSSSTSSPDMPANIYEPTPLALPSDPSDYKLSPSSDIFYFDFGENPLGHKALFDKEESATIFWNTLNFVFWAKKRYVDMKTWSEQRIKDCRIPKLELQSCKVSEYLEKYKDMDISTVNQYNGIHNAYNSIAYFSYLLSHDEKEVQESLVRFYKERNDCKDKAVFCCEGVISKVKPNGGYQSAALCGNAKSSDCFSKCCMCGGWVCSDEEMLFSCARTCESCNYVFCSLCYKGKVKEGIVEGETSIVEIEYECAFCEEIEEDRYLINCRYCEELSTCDCGCGKKFCSWHLEECVDCGKSFAVLIKEGMKHETKRHEHVCGVKDEGKGE